MLDLFIDFCSYLFRNDLKTNRCLQQSVIAAVLKNSIYVLHKEKSD